MSRRGVAWAPAVELAATVPGEPRVPVRVDPDRVGAWFCDTEEVQGASGVDPLAGRGVSAREREVLIAVAGRCSNAEIAAQFGLSERTVETHVSSLLRKLGVASRRHLERFAPCLPGRATRGTDGRRRDLPLPLRRLCDDGPWFGRQAQLDELLGQWAAAQEARVVLVRGEPGIGKSRLVAELGAEVHRTGGAVALGACVDGPQRPFEPFVTGLAAAGAVLDDHPTLARLVPRPGCAGAEVLDPERERHEVQAALVDTMITIAGDDGLVFVVEDLHWASEATREVLEVIARSPGPARLLVVGTTRERHAEAPDRYAAFLGRLARSPSVTTLLLDGLDLAATAQLIDAERSSLDPADGVARSGGNPLFLRQLVRNGPASRSMGEAVADLFTSLDDDELDIIDIAVASGDPLDVGLVTAASGRSRGAVLDALEHAEATGIVRDGGRPGVFVFTHDVFRSGRYASLTSGRRMRLHAAVAVALDRPDLDEHLLPTVARHAGLAGARFDPSRAAELCRRAGDAAMRAADHGAAAGHYGRALDSMALDPATDGSVRLAVTIDLGASLLLSGERGGDQILRGAVHDARRRGDTVAVAAALVAMTQVPGGHSPVLLGQEFESIVAETVERLPAAETQWRIRLTGTLGTHLYFSGEVERAMQLLEDALDAARRTADPVTIGRALMYYRWGSGPFAMAQRIACGHELIALGERTRQDVFSMVGCQQLAWCHRQLGDRNALDRWHAAAARLVRGPDLEQLSVDLSIAVLDGDLDRAERFQADIVGLAGPGRVYADGCRFCLDDIHGRLVEPKVIEAAIAAEPASRWQGEPFIARALARTGRSDRAGPLLVEARARGYGPPAANAWTTMMSCLAEAAALCGDVDVAADVAELLAPLAGRWIDNGLTVWDTVDRARALCLLTIGDAATAADLARAAAETSTRRATPILRARELIVAACADAVLGRSRDDALWREALAIAHVTGARLIEHDARLLLGTAAVRDGTGLTRREREIIDHVARGDTNRQIASALGISEATVRKHLEGAFRKLGVSTRTAAVARLRGEH